jgi:hypothetical protein
MDDYDSIESLSPEEFARLTPSEAELRDANQFTRSTDYDLRSIERILNLREGALGSVAYYVERDTCPCGRLKTAYDFVFTAMVDAGHSREFITNILVGDKLIVNEPRALRCSASGHLDWHRPPAPRRYHMRNYGCSRLPLSPDSLIGGKT